MKKNVGTFDRFVRILLVIILTALYFLHTVSGVAAIAVLAAAAIFLVTAIVGTCPIYLALGLSTAPKKN